MISNHFLSGVLNRQIISVHDVLSFDSDYLILVVMNILMQTLSFKTQNKIEILGPLSDSTLPFDK